MAGAFDKVIWMDAPRGRAWQMNKAARKATGDILLFLHADSRIGSDAINAIPGVLSHALAGSCYLEFDTTNTFLNLYSNLSRLNISLFTYGDQGLFMRRDVFHRIKGYREIPIMEDYEMVCRLKKVGKFIKLNHPVVTSSRRYQRNGAIRQQLKNIVLVGMYKLGVSPSFISRFYRY